MEELVGKVWHRWITRASMKVFPCKAAKLTNLSEKLSIQFRTINNDKGLQLLPSQQTSWNAPSHWITKIAGSGEKVELATRDQESYRLPSEIACFDSKELNQKLYLWLLLLLSVSKTGHSEVSLRKRQDEKRGWLRDNQKNTLLVFKKFPAARSLYFQLAKSHVALRREWSSSVKKVSDEEICIQQVLLNPDVVKHAIVEPENLEAVPLWLHPTVSNPDIIETKSRTGEIVGGEQTGGKKLEESHRKQGERVDESDGRDGLLAFRLESLFSWSEFANLDRTADNDSEENAQAIADDLDVLSLSNTPSSQANKLKFDLDLPAASQDDDVLLKGILLPEWHYKKKSYQPEHCALQVMRSRGASPCTLPKQLTKSVRKLKAQFESITQDRLWLRSQLDGSDLDLDSIIQYRLDLQRGYQVNSPGLYKNLQQKFRDISCLLLADLSLSTDAWINNEAQVIDVIRDSLFLFSEALESTGDRYAICGFSSVKRSHNRYYQLKQFSEILDDKVRGRINAIKPGYYTRMGPAIRYASQTLLQQSSTQKLLILLTDGKPNDIDCYEGRYGIEDTRKAILEAKQMGLTPFCITIDENANQYSPYLFGLDNYILVKRASELPNKLLKLYANLTR